MGNTVLNLREYKMKCAEVESLASDYAEGELAEPVRLSVKRHAFDCLDCAEMLSELSELTEWARSLSDLPLSNQVSQRLRAKLCIIEESVN